MYYYNSSQFVIIRNVKIGTNTHDFRAETLYNWV